MYVPLAVYQEEAVPYPRFRGVIHWMADGSKRKETTWWLRVHSTLIASKAYPVEAVVNDRRRSLPRHIKHLARISYSPPDGAKGTQPSAQKAYSGRAGGQGTVVSINRIAFQTPHNQNAPKNYCTTSGKRKTQATLPSAKLQSDRAPFVSSFLHLQMSKILAAFLGFPWLTG